VEIRAGGLDDPQVQTLLALHRAESIGSTPPGYRFALDLSGLRRPDVTFWSAWDGETLLGMAALRELAPDHGEVKSMRSAPDALRQGVGRALLHHLIAAARARAYARLSLETGTAPMFGPANAMYEAAGFRDCPPFGDYPESPHNRFMALEL
jgi:putative acetyltransferase